MQRRNPQTGEREWWVREHVRTNADGTRWTVKAHWMRINPVSESFLINDDHSYSDDPRAPIGPRLGSGVHADKTIDRILRFVADREKYFEAERQAMGLLDLHPSLDRATGTVHVTDVLNLSRTSEVNREIMSEEYIETWVTLAEVAFADPGFNKALVRLIQKTGHQLSEMAERLEVSMKRLRQWTHHPADDEMMVEVAVLVAEWTGLDEADVYVAALTSAGLTEVKA